MEKTCSSCASKTEVYVEFHCPNCGENITRCGHCRSVNNPYKCVKCAFEGA